MRVRRKLSEYSRQELLKLATSEFQTMIRAEAGVFEGSVMCWLDGYGVREIFSPCGECVCVTCGKVYPWRGTNLLDSGHAVPGRRQSVVFDERICAPQCVSCNRYHGGYPQRFQEVVARAFGSKTLVEILQQAQRSVVFSKDELLDKVRIYRGRTREAVAAMEC